MAANKMPTQFPVDEIQRLLPILRGQVPEVGEVIKDVWWIIGYGIGQFTGNGSINALTVQPSLALLTDGALATYLENACPHDGSGGKPMRSMNASAVPWDLVIPALLALLRRWAESRR